MRGQEDEDKTGRSIQCSEAWDVVRGKVSAFFMIKKYTDSECATIRTSSTVDSLSRKYSADTAALVQE